MGLIADVFDAVLQKSSGDTFATTTLQDANIEVTVQETEVRGGKGNNLIGVLHSGRDINVTMTDPEFRYETLAMQLGQDVVTGAGVAYATPKWYTVTDNAGSMEITLDEEPLTGTLALYDEDGEKVAPAGYTVTAKKVVITAANAGDKFEARTYKYNSAATTETIEIDAKTFATGMKLILETLEIDGETETPIAKIQYQFDNAIPTGNFNVNTASERNASANEMSLKIVKPRTSDVVGRVLRIPLV